MFWLGGLVEALVARRSERPTLKATLCITAGVTVFFLVVGDLSGIAWLLVVLSLAYVAYLFRREPLDNRHPHPRDQAFREALFAFGFTSLLFFSIGNFSTPDDPLAPLRMAVTMGPAWAVVAYRLARGYPQGWWRLLATLLAVGLPITLMWIAMSILLRR